jgi:Na+-transporting NADH:ubiquinone oxidoreductase subunit F
MEQIILGVTVVSAVIISLVLVINFAEGKLLPQGNISILINDDTENEVKTRPGSTLLNVLSNQTIFLPSACGGGGTCAMCKCQVFEGGGDILSTETSHITRSEAKDNWR